ncbi:hypothetical protein, partial [Staphylococcus epidermidis]|uniref:hypothetical protein n=1 Tax=Staphylococcus epidermidis TaxID=1282 RepID=UPI001C936999
PAILQHIKPPLFSNQPRIPSPPNPPPTSPLPHPVKQPLIQSFILPPNQTLPQHFNKFQLPFIYPLHQQPKSHPLTHFFHFITNFPIMIKPTRQHIH